MRRLGPLLGTALLVGALSAGWYRSHANDEAELQRTARRLSAAEKELAEVKGDFEQCKAWMDARLLMAQALGTPPVASAAPAPAASSAAAAPGGVAEAPPGEHNPGRLVPRRRRVLELHGQLLNFGARETPEAGTNP